MLALVGVHDGLTPADWSISEKKGVRSTDPIE